MTLLCDTGPILAALDRTDAHHAACRDLLAATREHVAIPSPVLVELDYWAQQRLGTGAFLSVLEQIERGALLVFDLVAEDYARIRALCDRYADSEIGFVDAAVLAIVERLGEPKLATLDHRHFRMLRPRHVDALQLLPD